MGVADNVIAVILLGGFIVYGFMNWVSATYDPRDGIFGTRKSFIISIFGVVYFLGVIIAQDWVWLS